MIFLFYIERMTVTLYPRIMEISRKKGSAPTHPATEVLDNLPNRTRDELPKEQVRFDLVKYKNTQLINQNCAFLSLNDRKVSKFLLRKANCGQVRPYVFNQFNVCYTKCQWAPTSKLKNISVFPVFFELKRI